VALPTILVNSTGGSDTAASGAGPATALSGSAASFTGDQVIVDGSVSGVATDGSAVLYMVTSTGVKFFKITAHNGIDTLTVTPNPAGTNSGLAWAIGGKRASLTSASSLLLVNNGGAAADAKPGWVIEFESGHTETKTSRLDIYVSGNTTDGPFTIRGASGADVKPVFTLSGGTSDMVVRGSYILLKDFSIAGASSATNFLLDVNLYNRYEGLTVSGFSGILFQGGSVPLTSCHIIGCELNGGSTGIWASQNLKIIGNRIHDQTANGIVGAGSLSGLTIAHNLIHRCGADGVYIDQGRTDAFAAVNIFGNTVTDCTIDGIDYTGDGDGLAALTIINNLLTANGGYGLKFTSLTANKVLARGPFIRANNTHGNTSGACNLAGVLEDDAGLDPDFAADFTPQNEALEGTAFPTTLP
jgi:hypothetical protein